ncbi:MAG: hypothetical protein J6P71_06115 [Oscillospiraceae bacterium]|nr:hypothetical protein [Oscillospiraceae bacterium]
MKKLLSLLLALALIFCLVPAAFAADGDALAAADTLHALGLFNGIGDGPDGKPIYDLDRAPSRNEAVAMLVRLLGKEEEAMAGTWETPFTDLDDWVRPYVGYAYANKLTYGTSATTFGGGELVSATQYLTFVLRALGYDSSKDFAWNEAWKLSDEIGLTHGEYGEENNYEFLRADVAEISRSALDQKLAASEERLIESLIAGGAVSPAAAEAAGYEGFGPKNGDVVYVKGEFKNNVWFFDLDSLTRAFPTAVAAARGTAVTLNLGRNAKEQALYDAVYKARTGAGIMLDGSASPQSLWFSLYDREYPFLFDSDGNTLAYFDSEKTGKSGDTLAFVVDRIDCGGIWEQISSSVESAVKACAENTVLLDTERAYDTWESGSGTVYNKYPLYFNGKLMGSLPERYNRCSFLVPNARLDMILRSEDAFRAELRSYIFSAIWGAENTGSADSFYTMDNSGKHIVEVLIDKNRNVVGYFLVNIKTDFTIG